MHCLLPTTTANPGYVYCMMQCGMCGIIRQKCQEGLNPKTGEISKSLRARIEQIPGNVLRLAAEGRLLPAEPLEV